MTVKTLTFVAELLEFIADLASGNMMIERARERAAELLARKPEEISDRLLAELRTEIAELENPDASER